MKSSLSKMPQRWLPPLLLISTLLMVLLTQDPTHRSVGAFSSTPLPQPKSGVSTSDQQSPLFSRHAQHKQAVQHADANNTKDSIVLTYLEINGWLLTMNNGLTILIDPILEGALDFGVPQLFKGEKRVLPTSGLTEQLPLDTIDCLLLTQGLEDHAHVKSLTKLRQVCEQNNKQLPIIAPPSAKSALQNSGWYGNYNNIRFLDHGETTKIASKDELLAWNPLQIQATTGALVGPPWQKRENGYLLSTQSMTDTNQPIKLYIEPHVEFDRKQLSEFAPINVLITPTTGQALPAFELVHGPKSSLQLVETLQPRYIVPMPNADIDTSGVAAPLVNEVGRRADFAKGLVQLEMQGKLKQLPEIASQVDPGMDVVLEL